MPETPIACAALREQLPLLVGSDLEEGREAVMLEHLESCTECRREAQRAVEARERFLAITTAEVGEPPRLWEAVRGELLALGLIGAPVVLAEPPRAGSRGGAAAPGGPRSSRALLPRRALASLAAALALGLGGWMLVGSDGRLGEPGSGASADAVPAHPGLDLAGEPTAAEPPAGSAPRAQAGTALADAAPRDPAASEPEPSPGLRPISPEERLIPERAPWWHPGPWAPVESGQERLAGQRDR